MVRLSATCLAALALALTAEGSEWSASQLDGFDLGMKTLVIGSGRDNDIPELVLEGYRYAEHFNSLECTRGFLYIHICRPSSRN